MKKFERQYDNIISMENLLVAWRCFKKNKINKKDVQIFERDLMRNLFELHSDLKSKKYIHSGYFASKISDPKPRDIHKAIVRDRVVHHLLYNTLYSFFNNKFIYDSYSCRINKGTHKAIYRFQKFQRIVSKNHTKQCHILKCDIRKFFANIDHKILKSILMRHVEDTDTINLLNDIINSFETKLNTTLPISSDSRNSVVGGLRGLPLGNLTSQLLVNIYMNEFDQYIKHKLQVKYYIRYADDFVIFSQDTNYLENLIIEISSFLTQNLKIELHPNKVFIKTISSGVDFLGWVNFPNHRVLRSATRRRMWRNIKQNQKPNTVESYLGLLKYGDTYKIIQKICLKNGR